MGVILILEDDQSRVDRFRAVLDLVAPRERLVIWRSARKMVRDVDAVLAEARVISLDHDLNSAVGETEDPGDGLEVAKHLAMRRPSCPVIIHSSNADRVRMMAGEFELAGMEARTVLPFGADWVKTYWARMVKEFLLRD